MKITESHTINFGQSFEPGVSRIAHPTSVVGITQQT